MLYANGALQVTTDETPIESNTYFLGKGKVDVLWNYVFIGDAYNLQKSGLWHHPLTAYTCTLQIHDHSVSAAHLSYCRL